MRAFATRWLTGDERTLGLVLATGLLSIAFFRLDKLRADLGVAPTPDLPLVTLLVATALAWWSMLPRGFVWLDPPTLTWEDYGALDRERLVARRMARGWLVRQLALGYLLALLAAIGSVPVEWTMAGAAVVLAAGALAFTAIRLAPGAPRSRPPGSAAGPMPGEAIAVAGFAGFAVVVRPGTWLLFGLAAVLVGGALRTVSRTRRPHVSLAGRVRLVDGWRDRVLRTSGLQFLDLALLLPAARPVRVRTLRAPTGLRLAWLGILGRARHLATAGLLALAAVATHHAFPALLDEILFALLGYLALVPLGAGLGELWRSPGRRRWVGRSDLALRLDNFVVLTGLAAAWAAFVLGAGLAGPGWNPTVLLTIPLMSACTIRTVTRVPPTYDNPASVDTPIGSIPLRLIAQTVRGPDVGLLALVFLPVVPVAVGAGVVAVVVGFCLLR